jgi:hypothetical protein
MSKQGISSEIEKQQRRLSKQFLFKRVSSKFANLPGITVLEQDARHINLRDLKNLKLRGPLGNPLPLLYELGTQAVIMSK